MSTVGAEMHEQARVPKSPEQVFVEDVIKIGLDAYNYVFYNPEELVRPRTSLVKHHKEQQLLQQAALIPLADKATAIAILADAYQEPEEAAAKLAPEYNDHAALALFRVGDKIGANLYLDDQLDKVSVIDELAVIAGLGDQSAANILPSLIKPGDEQKVFDTLEKVFRTAYGSSENEVIVDIHSLTELVPGPRVMTGKRHNRQLLSQGDLVRFFIEIKCGATTDKWEAFVNTLNESRESSMSTFSNTSLATRARMFELHEDAVRYYDMPQEQKDLSFSNIWNDYYHLGDDTKVLLRPRIERVLDLLPFHPKEAYPDVVAEYTKLTPEKQQEYRPVMAARIGQAGFFTESMHYLQKLPKAEQVKVAYEIATFYYDKGIRFTMPRPPELRDVDPGVASILGQLGADAAMTALPSGSFTYQSDPTKISLIAEIRADIEVTRLDGEGYFTSPVLQNAKLKALQLADNRECYDALHAIRDEERNQAVLHLSEVPANLPEFEVWTQMRQVKDFSWLNGLPRTDSTELPKK